MSQDPTDIGRPPPGFHPSAPATPRDPFAAAAGEVEEVLPLVEETLSVGKRTVELGTVRVRTVLSEREELARADLFRHAVHVDRVPINREVDTVPAPWEDGDTLVIPVVEEVVVVEKRLILREEIRVQRRREVEQIAQPVRLRSMDAVVERHAAAARPLGGSTLGGSTLGSSALGGSGRSGPAVGDGERR